MRVLRVKGVRNLQDLDYQINFVLNYRTNTYAIYLVKNYERKD